MTGDSNGREDQPEGKSGALVRPGPTGRVQLRAAFALEEAGELREAARLFEHVGEHAQAAALRLEHAHTLRDEDQRLAVLREGAARNRGDTEQGAALHRSLARAILTHVEAMPESARRRGLLVEAAQALEEADAGAEAGGIYEALGMLTRAAAAYEAAGEVNKLELVLTVLERREQAEQALRELERDVDEAWREGRRSLARTLMHEHVRDAQRRAAGPSAILARRLAELERALLRPERVHLRYGTPSGEQRIVHVHLAEHLRIGRSPECEVTVQGATLSREHVVLAGARDADGRPEITATDQGTPAGTFWQGEALIPGEPETLRERGELGLGFATALEVAPIPSRDGVVGALVGGTDRDWALFVPRGGPLLLDPGQLAPAAIEVRRGVVTLVCASTASTWLGDQPLGRGAVIELLVHDRIRFEVAGEPSLKLEVVA